VKIVRVLVLLLVVAGALGAGALLVFPRQVQGLRFQRLSQAAYEDSPMMARLLLRLGADPDGGDYNDTVPFAFVTPLGTAASRGNLDVVEVLLENGANPDAADPTGFTPLAHAASQGHADIVRALLAAGARTDVMTMTGTALDLARSGGHEAVVRLLEQASAAPGSPGAVRGEGGSDELPASAAAGGGAAPPAPDGSAPQAAPAQP
jgi:uncharacterized protein